MFNDVLPDPAGAEPLYDAIAEDWFDSLAEMQAAYASPVGQAVMDDVPNFIDPAGSMSSSSRKSRSYSR